MRFTRILAALVAAVTATMLGLTMAPASTAAVTSSELAVTESTAASTPVAQRTKLDRTLKVKIKSSSRRILAGKVKPKPGKRTQIIIKKAKKADGNFKTSRKFKTKKNGKWQIQMPRGNYYFYLVVKGNKKYNKFVSGKYVVTFKRY